MNDSMRDLLRQGADAVERPDLNVGDLVAQADRRLRRRRFAAVGGAAVAVGVITAGGLALTPGDQQLTPPPAPQPTVTLVPATPPETTLYFDALSGGGDGLTTVQPDIDDDLDIYLTRDGDVRRVIGTKANERCPVVSPDGKRLAYLSGARSEVTPLDVVVVPLDDDGDPKPSERQVVARDAYEACPQWSPDGRLLGVLAGDVEWPDLELRVVRPDGTARTLADLERGLVPQFAWSPDGDEIAYTTQDSVWLAAASGGEPERLWRGTATPDPDPYGLPMPGAPQALRWLPTGEVVVIALVSFTEDGQDQKVHLLDPDTGRGPAFDFASRPELAGSWSPDGTHVVVADGKGGIRSHDRESNATVTLRPQLAGEPTFSIYSVAWSRDGDRLVAVAYRSPKSAPDAFALVSMHPDGTSVEVLTPWTKALYWTEAETSMVRPR